MATDYDWLKAEAKLNALPQFITEIDGLGIHFIHVRLKQMKPLGYKHFVAQGGLGHYQNLKSLSNVIGLLVELNIYSSESTH